MKFTASKKHGNLSHKIQGAYSNHQRELLSHQITDVWLSAAECVLLIMRYSNRTLSIFQSITVQTTA